MHNGFTNFRKEIYTNVDKDEKIKSEKERGERIHEENLKHYNNINTNRKITENGT